MEPHNTIFMDDTTIAPDAGTDESQLAGTEVTDGQGTEGEQATATLDPVQPTFDQELSEFYQKKGWDPEKGLPTLFKSYQELESKLGNYSDIEKKAMEYDRMRPDIDIAFQKAQAWEREQLRIREEQAKGVQDGTVDIAQLPVTQLADLWKSGKIGLNDLPPERQYEVQSHVNKAEAEFDRQIQTQTTELITRHPILKDEKVADLIANKIEQGVKDPQTGRWLTPDEIVTQYEAVFSNAERKGEDKVRAEIDRIKNGNLERTTSAAPTKSKRTITNVRDAFFAAKDEMDGI